MTNIMDLVEVKALIKEYSGAIPKFLGLWRYSEFPPSVKDWDSRREPVELIEIIPPECLKILAHPNVTGKG